MGRNSPKSIGKENNSRRQVFAVNYVIAGLHSSLLTAAAFNAWPAKSLETQGCALTGPPLSKGSPPLRGAKGKDKKEEGAKEEGDAKSSAAGPWEL